MSTTAMIVDDSALMRRMLRTVLETAGLTVVGEACSGEEAVELYSQLHPGIVTMDITMPGIDGIETTGWIINDAPDAKIIIVTALATSFRLEDAFAAGAKGCVVKPFSPAQCVEEVMRVLKVNEGTTGGIL